VENINGIDWEGIARRLLAENQEKRREIDVLTRMLQCYLPELGNEKD